MKTRYFLLFFFECVGGTQLPKMPTEFHSRALPTELCYQMDGGSVAAQAAVIHSFTSRQRCFISHSCSGHNDTILMPGLYARNTFTWKLLLVWYEQVTSRIGFQLCVLNYMGGRGKFCIVLKQSALGHVPGVTMMGCGGKYECQPWSHLSKRGWDAVIPRITGPVRAQQR